MLIAIVEHCTKISSYIQILPSATSSPPSLLEAERKKLYWNILIKFWMKCLWKFSTARKLFYAYVIAICDFTRFCYIHFNFQLSLLLIYMKSTLFSFFRSLNAHFNALFLFYLVSWVCMLNVHAVGWFFVKFFSKALNGILIFGVIKKK